MRGAGSCRPSVDIARSVAAVWEIVGDFAHDRRWGAGIYRSEWTSPGPMAAGATLLEGARFLGRDILTHSAVTAYEPGGAGRSRPPRAP